MSTNTLNAMRSLLEAYLGADRSKHHGYVTPEVEIRFLAQTAKYEATSAPPMTKIQYERVIQTCLAHGFTTKNTHGDQYLRIYPEGMKLRAELQGQTLIQSYCETNSLRTVLDDPSTPEAAVMFLSKKAVDSFDRPLDIEEWRLRWSYQWEQQFHPSSSTGQEALSKWMDTPKFFRLLNRVRLHHSQYPFFIDLSVIRSNDITTSKNGSRRASVVSTVQESGIMDALERYEVEIELDNDRIGPGTPYNEAKQLLAVVQKGIRLVLSGLQQTPYPVNYAIQQEVLSQYCKLTNQPVTPKPIICGPSSITLQQEHLMPHSGEEVSVLKDYVVTEKADGMRALLFVAEDGRLYILTPNVDVVFTGATTHPSYKNTLLDGEWITQDRVGKPMFLFAAFDLYYIRNESCRAWPFLKKNMTTTTTAESAPPKDAPLPSVQVTSSRYLTMMRLLGSDYMKVSPITATSDAVPFTVICKTFYTGQLYESCKMALHGQHSYHTDGLIFTPAYLAVGASKEGQGAGPLKGTWEYSFKWKPPQFNTVDFLVTYDTLSDGKPAIQRVAEQGVAITDASSWSETLTLVLSCGFDKMRDIYENPFEAVIQGMVPTTKSSEHSYVPQPFVPTQPTDSRASYCSVPLTLVGDRRVAFTEESQEIENHSIIEFRYDMSNPAHPHWVPMRVRYDKTAQYRAGLKNFGNSYRVANANWRSIHSPITDKVLTGVEPLPPMDDNGVYYNRQGQIETRTKALRHFHNNGVKSRLIHAVAKEGQCLIDYAVGKGGDLNKWIAAKLGFVFGIDVARDNIHNTIDGVCVRYLQSLRRTKLAALFVQGNSALNIRSGEAFSSMKEKQIARALFGSGPKDKTQLGDAAYQQYGVGKNGFHVSSIQFAFHYLWESTEKLHGFLQNVAENTRIDGYFIGTCFDGKRIFQYLSDQPDGIILSKEGSRIFELKREYTHTGMVDDETCVGYAIQVWQESINQWVREYLVNFEYLRRLMENYGFVPLTPEEYGPMGLPESEGSFELLYNPSKTPMSPEEKQLSFMNRYFIYKKVREVSNPAAIKEVIQIQERDAKIDPLDVTTNPTVVASPPPKQTFIVKRIKKKILLPAATDTATAPLGT